MKKLLVVAILLGILGGLLLVNSSTKNGESVQQVVVATATPTPVRETPQEPAKVRIPKIAVDAQIEHVGLDEKRNMDVPQEAENVAWYMLGPRPGQVGNAVLAGHLDTVGGAPAVFYRLSNLQVGDEILTEDDSSKIYHFKVVDIQKYPFDQFPIETVFGKTDKTMLNLITCEGTYDEATKNYSDRVVVYSELIV